MGTNHSERSAAANGETSVLRAILSREMLSCLLMGFSSGLPLYIGVQLVDPVPVVPHYARICAQLSGQKEYRNIGQNDLWIAAHARAFGMTVVTNNTSHFARVPGLAVEDWTT